MSVRGDWHSWPKAYDVPIEVVRIAAGSNIPQINPAVLRVLDAARAWRKSNFIAIEPLGTNLANAIDALDAPRERFVVSRWDVSPITGIKHPWCVWDLGSGNRCVADCRDEADAEKVAQALNAADAREGR